MKKDSFFLILAYFTILSMVVNDTPLWFGGTLRKIPVWICFFSLIAIRYKTLLKKKNIVFLAIFFILAILSYLIRLSSDSPIPLYCVIVRLLPLILYMSITKEEIRYFKPMGYLFIMIFIANCLLSYYERLTFSFVLNYDVEWVGNLQKDVLESGNRNFGEFLLFRPMALFGHPLTNANLISFMSFSIFFSNYFNRCFRILMLTMGGLSLICFNSRGAQLIFLGLLFLLVIDYFLNRRNRFLPKLFFGIALFYLATLVIDNFELLGGRFVTKGFEDDSTQVRVDAINYFFSLSFYDLLVGGNELKFGENGALMIIEELGLLLGGLFLYLHIYFSWKVLNYRTSIAKIIIFSAFFIVSCTNNNLYYPFVFSLYILFVICVNNTSIPFQYLNNNKSNAINKENEHGRHKKDIDNHCRL